MAPSPLLLGINGSFAPKRLFRVRLNGSLNFIMLPLFVTTLIDYFFEFQVPNLT